MVHLHGLEYIQSVLDRVASNLGSDVTAYHIGGNAMCVLGLKDMTKDTDLVFLSEEEVKAFKNALLAAGFMEKEIVDLPEYRGLNAWGIFEEGGGGSIRESLPPRMSFDLFLKKVCGKLNFSQGMVSRGREYITFGKLVNNVCSKEDVFMFKAMAGRSRDIEDMVLLVAGGIDWDVIAGEFLTQANNLSSAHKSIFISSVSRLSSEHNVSLPASFTRKINSA